jgi:streptogramin lyase
VICQRTGLAVAALWLLAFTGPPAGRNTSGGAQAVARPVQHIRLGRIPLAIAAGAGSVWVSSAGSPTAFLLQLDPQARAIRRRIPVGRTPVAIAIWNHEIWVANGIGASMRPHPPGENTVMRINASTGKVTMTVPVRDPESITAGLGAIWVGRPGGGIGAIIRIDPSTSRVTKTIPIPADGPVQLAAGFHSLWALTPRIRAGHPSRSTLFRIDSQTGQFSAQIAVPGSSDRLAVGDDGVWIGADARVLEVNPSTNQLLAEHVALRGGNLTTGDGSVWVTGTNGNVWRIDPRRKRFDGQPTKIGASADELAFGLNAVWVTDSQDRAVAEIAP